MAKKISFTINLTQKQVDLMMQLETQAVYGDTRAEIASNLILEQIKQLRNEGHILTPKPKPIENAD